MPEINQLERRTVVMEGYLVRVEQLSRLQSDHLLDGDWDVAGWGVKPHFLAPQVKPLDHAVASGEQHRHQQHAS